MIANRNGLKRKPPDDGLDRRAFLRRSATLVVGAVVAGRLGECRAAAGDSRMVIAYGFPLTTLDP